MMSLSDDFSLHVLIIGVHLSLRENFIANNSRIRITDIGEGTDRALVCYTNNYSCCNVQGRGWFFPNGSLISSANVSRSVYLSRGRIMLSLNRRNNAMPPSGLYCCEIPDRDGNIVRMCTTICKSRSSPCMHLFLYYYGAKIFFCLF